MPHSIETDRELDTGLACLVLLARFQGLPADPEHLAHQRGQSGFFSLQDIVLSAKGLGLKAKALKSDWRRLEKTPLPAIAVHKDGHYFILVDISNDAILDEVKGLMFKTQVSLQRSLMQIGKRQVQLTPGMSVTVEIKTGTRRVIEFFLAPLLRYKQENIRER